MRRPRTKPYEGRLALLLLLLMLLGRPAMASSLEGIGCAFVTAFWTFPVTVIDIGFAGSAIHQARIGEHNRSVAIAEVVIMAPQLMVSTTGLGFLIHESRSKTEISKDMQCALFGVVLTTVFSAALFGHGVWVLTQPAAMPQPDMATSALTPPLSLRPYLPSSGGLGLLFSKSF